MNRSFVHTGCESNVFDVLETDDPLTTPFEVFRALEETEDTSDLTNIKVVVGKGAD